MRRGPDGNHCILCDAMLEVAPDGVPIADFRTTPGGTIRVLTLDRVEIHRCATSVDAERVQEGAGETVPSLPASRLVCPDCGASLRIAPRAVGLECTFDPTHSITGTK